MRWWEHFVNWANVTIYERGRIEIRRLDILVAFGFILCVSYYGWSGGWSGALLGGALYVFITMCALWIL